MVTGRESQTQDGCCEEDSEHKFVLEVEWMGCQDQDVNSEAREEKAPEQMGPNVGCFSVETEDGPETGSEGLKWWSVACSEVIIVLQPGWQVSEVVWFPVVPNVSDVLFGRSRTVDGSFDQIVIHLATLKLMSRTTAYYKELALLMMTHECSRVYKRG